MLLTNLQAFIHINSCLANVLFLSRIQSKIPLHFICHVSLASSNQDAEYFHNYKFLRFWYSDNNKAICCEVIGMHHIEFESDMTMWWSLADEKADWPLLMCLTFFYTENMCTSKQKVWMIKLQMSTIWINEGFLYLVWVMLNFSSGAFSCPWHKHLSHL